MLRLWRWPMAAVVLSTPAAAMAHVGFFGGAGSRSLAGVLYLIFGAYAVVLVVCVTSFFVRSRTFFWVALSLAVLALLAGGLLLVNFIGMGGPVAVIPLGSALLGLLLVLAGGWRRSRRAEGVSDAGPKS